MFWSLYEFSHQGAPVKKKAQDIKESLEMLLITGLGENRGPGAEDAVGSLLPISPGWSSRTGPAGVQGAVPGAEPPPPLSLSLDHLALPLEICATLLPRVRRGCLQGQGLLPNPGSSRSTFWPHPSGPLGAHLLRCLGCCLGWFLPSLPSLSSV